jgi:hypothetical protein
MSNMDDFNKATALVLEKLYESFPQRISIDIEELEPDVDKNTLRSFADTLLFLEREGFIRFDSRITNEVFQGATLTSKGLAILNSVPEVLNEKTPLGQKLSGALKGGSKEVIKTVVNQIISAAVTGYIKASGG